MQSYGVNISRTLDGEPEWGFLLSVENFFFPADPRSLGGAEPVAGATDGVDQPHLVIAVDALAQT